jgi:dihydroorotate dehydrogenase electron transfer subunit
MPIRAKITKIADENPTTKTFWLKEIGQNIISQTSKPGQYVMIWVWKPGLTKKSGEAQDNIPMSVSDRDGDKFAMTIKKMGPPTAELFKYKKGMELGITGPMGNAFKLKGKRILLVSGGIGLAPLYPLGKLAKSRGVEVHTILGAKTKMEHLMVNQVRKFSKKVYITTDDGTYGTKGFATDAMDKIFKKVKIDQIYTCGPEIMMLKILEKALSHKIPVQFSLERYMHCGVGACGLCTMDGYWICNDGPVFTSSQLKTVKDFGCKCRLPDGTYTRY